MAVRFGPTIVFAVNALLPPPAPHQNKTETTAKVHSEKNTLLTKKKKSLQPFSVFLFFFFFKKWTFEKDTWEKKNTGEMCCNKEAVGRACF